MQSRQQLPRSAGAVMAPVDGRSLVFRDRKPDRHGVAVQSSGVVPLHARRPDGATLTASGAPMVEPLPDWLLVELGGRWGRPRAA